MIKIIKDGVVSYESVESYIRRMQLQDIEWAKDLEAYCEKFDADSKRMYRLAGWIFLGCVVFVYVPLIVWLNVVDQQTHWLFQKR